MKRLACRAMDLRGTACHTVPFAVSGTCRYG